MNARCLRAIAIFSFANLVVEAVRNVWSHYYLKATIQLVSGRSFWVPIPNLHGLFFVLVLFVIAAGVRVGVALEEERALTV